jgi:hypothetical protein
MKTVKTFVAFLVGCGLAAAQVEVGAESRPGNDRVTSQIKNLDNDSFELRTKAMEDLRAAGEDARGALEAAKTSQSLEVRTRAETLLKELDAKKAPAAGQKKSVQPVMPDDERKPGPVAGRAPRPDDFQEPRAYIEAMQKWMNEQFKRDQRFPTFVLPDGQDLKDLMENDLPGGVHVITPDMTMGGHSVSVITRDGETTTWKSGPDGVNVKITKRGEDGKTVTEEYSAKDEETFKAEHPDLWERHHPKDADARMWLRGSPFARGEKGQTVIVPQPVRPGIPGNDPFAELIGQPQLGVLVSPVPPVLDKHLKLKGEGVVVDSVVPDSLATRLGVRDLDVLVQLDGEVVRERGDIARVLRKKDAPATATARVIREGVQVDLSAPREKAK